MALPPEDLIRAREELAKMRSELATLMRESNFKHATGGVYDRLDRIESAHKLLDQQHSDGLATIAHRLAKLEASVASDGVSIPRILDRLAALEGPELRNINDRLNKLERAEASRPTAPPEPRDLGFEGEPVSYRAVVKERDEWERAYKNTSAELRKEQAAHRLAQQEGRRIVTLVAGCDGGYPNWKTPAELDELVRAATAMQLAFGPVFGLEAALKPFRK